MDAFSVPLAQSDKHNHSKVEVRYYNLSSSGNLDINSFVLQLMNCTKSFILQIFKLSGYPISFQHFKIYLLLIKLPLKILDTWTSL